MRSKKIIFFSVGKNIFSAKKLYTVSAFGHFVSVRYESTTDKNGYIRCRKVFLLAISTLILFRKFCVEFVFGTYKTFPDGIIGWFKMHILRQLNFEKSRPQEKWFGITDFVRGCFCIGQVSWSQMALFAFSESKLLQTKPTSFN